MAEHAEADSVKEKPAANPPEVAVPAVAEDDSDPDFDDLDDVLDQFSSATAATQKQPSQPAPSASGPGRPLYEIPKGQGQDETEEEFMTRLTKEMESVMSKMATEPAASSAKAEDIAKMGRELEELTMQMEKEGIQPEDLIKAILGEDTGQKVADAAKEDRDRAGESKVEHAAERSTFDDMIRRTMERMKTSDSKATKATKESEKSEEDMLAEILKAIDSEAGGGGDGGDGDLSQVFLGMMQQLTHKDMLYEPMKELDDKFPEWLEKNRTKLSPEDQTRYSNQRHIVKEIVAKFEESSYSDEDSGCREYIWDRMQKMQAEGSPPEDLIANPFPSMDGLSGTGGGGSGGGGAGGGGDEGDEAGCPTQ